MSYLIEHDILILYLEWKTVNPNTIPKPVQGHVDKLKDAEKRHDINCNGGHDLDRVTCSWRYCLNNVSVFPIQR